MKFTSCGRPQGVVLSVALGLTLLASGHAWGQAAPGEDPVDAAIERLGTHPPPPAFDGAKAAESQRLGERVEALRRELFEAKTEPTDEQLAEASAELRPAYDRIAELADQRRAWEAYQADPTGSWWEQLEDGGPVLAAAGPEPTGTADLFGFFQAAKRLEAAEYFLMGTSLVTAAGEGYPEPTVAEFCAVARGLEPYEQGAIVVGGDAAGTAAVGAYRLRAGYLRGRALVIAAFVALGEGRPDEARTLWRKGIGVLHQVERVFKLADQTGVSLGPLARLDAPSPDLLTRLRAADDHDFMPLGWDNYAANIGLTPGGMTQADTYTDLARLLEDVCPWSPPVFELLADLGQLDGIDLRVLRGPEVGTSSRHTYAPFETEKVWIASLGPGAIPPNVREDLEELKRGIVPLTEETLEWRNLVGTEQLTVWVVSPTVRDVQLSTYLTLVSKAVTISGCGAIAILADIGGDIASALAESWSPNNVAAQLAIGVGAESVPYELAFAGKGGLTLKNEGLNPVAMAKGLLLSVLGMVEAAEIEALFEGLDPTSKNFDARTQKATSYAGGWVPSVILRAMVVGWERTEPNEYGRMRLYTRYWLLDPAGLTAAYQDFDLSSQLVDELPNAAALRAGDVGVSRTVWRPLPWSKQPDGWGSRARTISIQPMTQTIDVSVERELEERWRDECPEDQALVLVLKHPPPNQDRMDVVPLGGPVRLCDPLYAKSEGLPPGFDAKRLFAAYDAHVVRVPYRSGARDTEAGGDVAFALYDFDSPELIELARFPLRLTGKDVTGELAFDDTRLHATLKYRYEDRPRREFELEPAPSGASLLGRALVVSGPYRPSGEVYQLDYYYERLKFSAAMGIADENTWYRLEVRVLGPAGQVGPTYQLHDLNRDAYGAAVFHGNVPVPVGTSQVHVSLAGAGAPEPVVMHVERVQPSDWEPVDHAKYEGYMQADLKQRGQAEDQEDWLYHHCEYLGGKLSLANAYAEIEHWNSARATLHEFAKEWPDVSRVQSERLRDSYKSRNYSYLRTLAKVSFQQGDVETMGPIGANWLTLERGFTEKSIVDHGNPEFRYEELAKKYAEFLDDYLSLGGGEAQGHLLAEWNELRRLSGEAYPQDARRFEMPGGTQ